MPEAHAIGRQEALARRRSLQSPFRFSLLTRHPELDAVSAIIPRRSWQIPIGLKTGMPLTMGTSRTWSRGPGGANLCPEWGTAPTETPPSSSNYRDGDGRRLVTIQDLSRCVGEQTRKGSKLWRS